MSLTDRPAHCTLDSELRFIAANDTLLWVLKKKREELIGARLLDLFPHAAGAPLHEALIRAQQSFAPQKGRYFSPLVERWIELEVHSVGGNLQVGFSPVFDP